MNRLYYLLLCALIVFSSLLACHYKSESVKLGERVARYESQMLPLQRAMNGLPVSDNKKAEYLAEIWKRHRTSGKELVL